MKIQTINKLCCPFCSGALKVKKTTQESEHGVHFGLIKCQSYQLDFPMVAGVLILGSPSEQINVWDEVSDNLTLKGVEIRRLCDLLAEGKNVEAFSLLLTPSGRGDLLFRPKYSPTRTSVSKRPGILPSSWKKKPLVPLRIQWLINKYSNGRLQRVCQRQLAHFLLNHSQDLAAIDVVELFYGDFSRSEMANYFTFRFGQPRHLAALTIASIIKERSGPILDLACGMGHLTHYFAWGEKQREVIGIDRDYFRLYVAKNFMVPDADFICQWVDRPLPFAEASFDSVFCSDAFHYFLDKVGLLREMERILSSNGVLAITRIGNLEQPPNEGYELTVNGYERLFVNTKHVFLGEDELIDGYLQKCKANLELREIKEIQGQKWLSVVMSKEDKLFCNQGKFSEYPHSVGHLIKNPIYSLEHETLSDSLSLSFEFPSNHYAYEDQRYQNYAPHNIDIPQKVLSFLENGRRTSELEDLIEKFVLIGAPRKFTSTQVLN